MIRRDETASNYKPLNSFGVNPNDQRELAEFVGGREESDKSEQVKQLEQNWLNAKEKYDAGLMSEGEYKEWELAQRLSASAEQDTQEDRKRKIRLRARFEELTFDLKSNPNAQTEEDFQDEQLDAQERYVKLQNKAYKMLEKEVQGGLI